MGKGRTFSLLHVGPPCIICNAIHRPHTSILTVTVRQQGQKAVRYSRNSGRAASSARGVYYVLNLPLTILL